MEFRPDKLLSALLFASGLSVSVAANAANGVSADDLQAWPALRMTDLVERARVAPDASVKARPTAEATAPAIAVEDVIKARPETIQDLMARVSGKLEAPVKAVVETKAAEAPVVRVTIPEEPGEAVASVAAVAAKAAPAELLAETPELVIAALGGRVTLTPQSLTFGATGKKVSIRVAGAGLEGLALFVRDQQIVELQKGSAELVAKSKGATELYAVVGGKMYIVPVTVAAGSTLDLHVPDALVSLDGVFQGSLQSALYPGLEQASSLPGARDEATAQDAPSLRDSLAETARAVSAQDRELDRYYASSDKLAYKAVTVQMLDERSAPQAGRIFPASGAQVHLVGTEFTGRTDTTGHLTVRDMPARSRFFAVVDDPTGQVRPAITEIRTGDEGQSGVIRLKVMRNFTFDALAEVAQVVQQAGLGSYCGSVVDRATQGAAAPNVGVQLDVAADGPFYFNGYGYLDRTLNATGPDGRFCYFNVLPGPLALTLYQDQALVATLPAAAFVGRHVEDQLVLNAEVNLTTRLASMATAHEQLSSDLRLANSYKTIDMIDLIPLGTQDPMMQLAPGLVGTSDAMLPRGGRVFTFAQAAEFEPTVYSYVAGAANAVTPLIPRGFVEDMSLYAQVSHDPSLGTVLVEYGAPTSVQGETISMKLVDGFGRDAGDGWYFADTPVTKAIFFNVPAGAYSILVETGDGYWLGSDTLIVYNETVSYVRMGGSIRYRP